MINHSIDKRSTADRRSKRFGGIRWLFVSGRRRQVRRKQDRNRIHILDYYSPEMFYFIVATLVLSVTDAFLTLWLIDHGAVELNSVMAYYIEKGPNVFLAIKYSLTATCITLTVLVNYVFFKLFRMQCGHILKVFAGCFGCVVIWELYLMMRFVA